ncbi:MAG: GlcNAc-PI de-N-acetylase [Gemmatimonadota bacterium]|nr:MAG: GlcNAc-PI de-N-acetylase [Gemmatimonadota bacterium]
MKKLSILGIFAHPDDESMGPGGTLAKYAAAGHRVAVVTATEGGAGRLFEERPRDEAGRAELRRTRREETAAAVRILGIEHLGFLGWDDGRLRDRDVLEAERVFAAILRQEKPDVVITFHGSGISYHPDHRFITLAVHGAFLGSAQPGWYRSGDAATLPPHRPQRLYHYTVSSSLSRADWPRDVYVSRDDEITTHIDTSGFADTKWAAIEAHASQQFGPPFRMLYEAGAFESEAFVRIHPPAAAGSETDLLDGLV